jgi:hypothetical protein
MSSRAFFLCIVSLIKAVRRKQSPIAEEITGAHLVCRRQFARCNSGRMIYRQQVVFSRYVISCYYSDKLG